MLAIYAYYAGIMFNAFVTYYAHNNYAGIIGSSLSARVNNVERRVSNAV